MNSSQTQSAQAAATSEFPKQYRPSDHEPRVWDRWIQAEAFHADPQRVLSGEAKPYTILIPPPNVTDRLHLGHALNNTLQDTLARFHRMRGFETLWMPGTDHAGIATQAVVEKRLRASGQLKGALRESMTRDQFVEIAQAFKDEYKAVIIGQLQKMGCSCDWDRERFTMDEQCAKAVREAFFRFFKDGLIYRGKRLVNWDPALQTAVADDECFDEEIEGAFYYLRYPLVHANPPGNSASRLEKARTSHSESGGTQDAQPVTWDELVSRGYPGAEQHPGDEEAWITVATTRPETYLGDTAVAINPHDPRAKALRGMFVELPLVGRVIPIVEDSYVVLPEAYARSDEEREDPKAKMATGFLKVTPAHDPNDYELGRRHAAAIEAAGNAVMINIFAPDATVSDKHGWTDVGSAHQFVGMSREDARKAVVAAFKSHGLLEGVKPHRHSVKHSDRSKAIIEPYLSDQWYVKVTDDRMAKAANEALAPEQRSGFGGSVFGGPPLRGGSSLPTALPSHRSGALIDSPPYPPMAPAGFVGKDPYPAGSPSPESLTRTHRYLPHVEVADATYFVTWRTQPEIELSPSERDAVMAALRHFEGDRVDIYAASVMSTHVHAIVHCRGETRLADWLASVKRFSARAINESRGSSGHFWQEESFDHIIRSAGYLSEFLAYIAMNPVEAGVVTRPSDYEWTYVAESALASLQLAIDKAKGKDPASERRATKGNDLEAQGKSVRFHPSRYAKTYEQWHDGIRDWCISRQLWWGHRVPVWTRVTSFDGFPETTLGEIIRRSKTREVYFFPPDPKIKLGEGDAAVFYEVDEEKRQVKTTVCLRHERASTEEYFDRNGYVRDPDVLDTWFSSGLWPLSTLGWPAKDEYNKDVALLRAFNPTSVLCTAREIITLWVSRMVMFNRYLYGEGEGKGPTPFHDVFIHAVIQDGQGQKMSKSLGNGVDPLDIIASHGADALRFTLCHMATQTQDVRMPVDLICPHTGETFPPKMITNKDGYVVPAPIQTSPKDPSKKMVTGYGVASGEAKASAEMPLARNTSSKFDLGRNFANKLWNATRFALSMLDAAAKNGGAGKAGDAAIDPKSLALVDRWMLSRLATQVAAAAKALNEYQFADHAVALYDLAWRDFCDWYLEAIKPTVASSPAQQAVLAHTIEAIVRALHPTMPYVTEVIFERLRTIETAPIAGVSMAGSRKGDLLATAGWPEIDAGLIDAKAEAAFDRVRALVTAIREVRAQHNVPPKRQITLHVPSGRDLSAIGDDAAIALVKTLCGVSQVTTEASMISVAFTFDAAEWRLSDLADAVDAASEKARLTKLIGDLEKSIATLDGRLSNPGYTDKAPAHMVQQTRDQLTKAKAERDAAKNALEALA